MKEVIIYTDGACTGNPGNGGYCAILIYKGVEKIISGGELNTTNNKMELLGVINGLKALKEPCKVNVYSDSQYVVDAFNKGYINSWILNGYKTADKKPLKNVELWQELIELTKIHKVSFNKVLGHSNVEYNEKCDKIAKSEYLKLNS